MKKNILGIALSLLVLAPLAINAEMSTKDLADHAIKHIDEASDYKSKWFDFKKNMNDLKYDILKKQHKAKMALKKKLISQLAKDEDVKAYLTNLVSEMKALKKKHHEEWKAFGQKMHEMPKVHFAQADEEESENESENAE